ncbi:MAG: hypothetical protein KZQ63_07050, partial [Candidatus Thiodiazotropha sp. (ex Lucinoma aequizonata)]|nr:hypothetical protein [Candidatus Thiodiazotropha sp. (ex Lucinoma aequizonata)]
NELNSYEIIIIFDAAAGKNSACIDNEARYKQARQYGFSEKMSFLPGTTYTLKANSYSKVGGQMVICPKVPFNYPLPPQSCYSRAIFSHLSKGRLRVVPLPTY